MPNKQIRTIAKDAHKDPKKAEVLWSQAKELARKSGHDKYLQEVA